MESSKSPLVTSQSALVINNATAAIIVLDDGCYLLQLRDDTEDIWYPGHWGCFGGGVESGEDALTALRRELREELGYDVDEAEFFVELDFDLTGMKRGRYYRKYYVIRMRAVDVARLSLHEGRAVRAFDGDSVLGSLKVTPYDAFVLFLHARAFRINGGP